MLKVIESATRVLRLGPTIALTPAQFYDMCRANPDLQLEMNAEGEIIIMPPAGSNSSDRNADLTMQLRAWALAERSGKAYDSSGGFRLPDGSIRAPDASWVLKSRLAEFTLQERERFLPLCPDFVAELRSPTDALETLQDKLIEYIANGARLGWLLDPFDRRVYVYRPDVKVEVVSNAERISGDPVLPGFTLELERIWEPDR
ncbi:MAG: Uma2 family endonuclease [Anaerolineae bacterium]